MSIIIINNDPDKQGDDYKFNNCKHKSKQSNSVIKSCCGKPPIHIRGFTCLKKNIFPLNKSVCNDCLEFENI